MENDILARSGVLALDQPRTELSIKRPARRRDPRGRHPEILLGIGHDLGIGGMIGRFHRDDAIGGLRVLVAEIFGKLGLGTGRADNKDFTGAADGVHHLPKKLPIQSDMTAADRIGLVVEVPRRHVRMQDDLVGAGQADVENFGLRMVDPDDRMKVRRHVPSFLLERPPG